MPLIPLTHLEVPPNRQRREHDPAKHQELVDSISKPAGLLHPPVVIPDGDRFRLLVGERRVRAITDLHELGVEFTWGGQTVPSGYIPVSVLSELSTIDAKEAELEENIRRDDLTWQDRTRAEAELVELRRQQAAAAGTPPPTLNDIAVEARGSARGATIADSIKLSKNLHRPEVAAAKTASEAVKALARIEERERNAVRAAIAGKRVASERHTLVQGDAVAWLRECPSATFDVILTDPPYGMGADDFGDSGGGAAGAHFYSDDADTARSLYDTLFVEGKRVCRADAHLYAFCDIGMFEELKARAEAAGWKVFRTPFIWFKPGAFRAPWPEHGPQRKYECILYARAGELKCTKLAGDVLEYNPDKNLGHNAQKPVELLKDLLSRSVRAGMKVLDPFCGTGGTLVAGHALGADVTAIELDAGAFGIAMKRLEELK